MKGAPPILRVVVPPPPPEPVPPTPANPLPPPGQPAVGIVPALPTIKLKTWPGVTVSVIVIAEPLPPVAPPP